MSVDAEWRPQWEAFKRSYEAGRLAHAYLVVAPPRGSGGAFAEAALTLLMAGGDTTSATAGRLAQRAHPDVVWVEPQSKSRFIRVDEMRQLNARMQQTASEGRWKAGIIYYADRMNEQASNAFLKTLEEPAGDVLLLLLTDAPHDLLPTIRSRCQQLVLRGHQELEARWREPLLVLLREQRGKDPLRSLSIAEGFRLLLDGVKSALESELEQVEGEEDAAFAARVQSRLLEVRGQIMRAVMDWQRDVLFCVLGEDDPAQRHYPEEMEVIAEQAAGLSFAAARSRIDAVDEMARRLGRLMPPVLTFDAGLSPLAGQY
jgi:DNA polymerase III subunit delta'